MKDSLVTKNRNTRPASGSGKLYGVGCLPLLVAWFLLDLIGKTIIYGIASLFGKPMPTLAMVIKWTAYSIATLIWILYVFISERISDLFQKGKKDKKDKKDKEQPTETSSTETES